MSELDELTDGKNWDQLLKELLYQLDNGEKPGGEIVGHVYRKAYHASASPAEREEVENVLKYHKVPKNAILYYAVYNNHTLGYIYLSDCYTIMFSILHASSLKGSPFNSLSSGPLFIHSWEKHKVRRATLQDFEEYRVSLPSDFDKLHSGRNIIDKL